MNWNDIQFFLSVSRNNSFVAAAKQLQVTHSTVSRRISALEKALEVDLFARTERGCILTPAGEKMIPFAEEFERSALKFKEHISVNSQQLTGKIRIGTPDGLGNCYLASELKALQEKNPLLEVELVSVPIYYSLSKREVDILITVTRPTAKRIMVEKIISYKFGLFASIEYLKSTPAIQDVADLNEHRLIGYIDDLLYDQRLRFLEEIFPAARTVFRSSTVLGQMSAIKAGAGIGVLPFFMIQTESDLVRILPDKYVEREFWIQVNPDSSKLTRVKETIDFILNIMRGDDKIFNSL